MESGKRKTLSSKRMSLIRIRWCSPCSADRLARFNIQIGQEVMVSFDIDAREYNGRWFNSIRAFDVRMVDPASVGMQVSPQAPMQSDQPAASQVAPQAPFPPQMPENSADDLPF